MNTLMASAAILAVLAVLISSSFIFKNQVRAFPEMARKIVHLIMGAICLSFPWLFDNYLPVFVLCLTVQIILLALKVSNGPARDLLFGVKRHSFGELLFPLAVFVIFILSRGNYLLYTVPVAVLAFADSAAALIGNQGTRLYRTRSGHKSVEGSLAFFVTAAVAAAIALGMFASLPLLNLILIALLLAALSTMVEGFSSHGFDNLLVPLAVFLTLEQTLVLPAATLIYLLISLSLLTVAVLSLRSLSQLSGNANLMVMTYCYLALSQGGVFYLLMPALMLLGFRLFLPDKLKAASLTPAHCENAVMTMSLTGLVYLVWPAKGHSPDLLFIYTLAFVTQGAITASADLCLLDNPLSKLGQLTGNVLKSWALLFVPYLLLTAASGQVESIAAILVSPLYVWLLTLLYVCTVRAGDDRNKPRRWIVQSLLTVLGPLTYLAMV